ncbi:DNA recombination protein RmuC [Helicobacter sp. 23-1045]
MIYVAILGVIFGVVGVVLAVIFALSKKQMVDKNKFLDSANRVNEARIIDLENALDNLNEEMRKVSDERASLRTALDYEKEIRAKEKEFFDTLKEQSKSEFKALSQDILSKNLESGAQNQKEQLNSLLKPLQTQIDAFKQQISEIHNDDIKERSNLMAEIRHLKDLNIRISADADNLSKALKGNNKTLGDWGEMILENLLADSGLVKGRDYNLQETQKNNEGKSLRPDVIINLPNNKKVIIDSKANIKDYERFVSGDSANNNDLLAHIMSLKTHIKELSKKSYESAMDGGSLDFVLMFIPIEGAFLEAVRYDNELFLYAYQKNIILVSPTTLLATLRTIANIWRNERQYNNVAEILSTASSLYDKFSGFYSSMESVGDNLKKADEAFQKSLNQLKDGKGSIYSKVQKLEELGVKYKAKLAEN